MTGNRGDGSSSLRVAFRLALVLGATLVSAPADAFDGPTVDQSMGSLSFEYPLDVPKARGRYQPVISLRYDSFYDGYGAGAGMIGRGWHISPEAVLGPDLTNPGRVFYNDSPTAGRLLVASPRDPGQYAADVESGYMTFREVDPYTWEAKDAIGNTYTFSATYADPTAPHHLTRVIDPDSNATRLVYDEYHRLQSIEYNAYNPSAGSPTNPVDGPFATVVEFEYGIGTTGYTDVRLRNIRVKNATANGLVTVRRYEIGYSSYDRYTDSGWETFPVVESIREYGGEIGPSLPPTTFYTVGDSSSQSTLSIVSPTGARWDMSWEWSSTFGDAVSQQYPVVKEMTTSGPALTARTVEYWYAASTRYAYRLWYDASSYDYRGFLQSWSQDSATGLVTHSWWEYAHALRGKERAVEVGTIAAVGTAVQPPTYSMFRRTRVENSARGIDAVGACTAVQYDGAGIPQGSEVAAASYPVIPFRRSVEDVTIHDGIPLTSSRTMACADLDAWGNPLKVTVNPDALSTADSSYVEQSTYEVSAAAPGVPCKDCVRERTRTTLAGALLEATWHAYGPTYLLASISKRPKPNAAYATIASWSYNPDGNVYSRSEGGVTYTYQYDTYQLRVATEEVRDAASSSIPTLVTETHYDASGRPDLVTGPYVPGTAYPRMQRGLAYDALGRLVAVAREPIALPNITRATAAFEYSGNTATPTTPTWARSYAFAVPKSYTLGAIPTTSDVRLSTSYFDGLGREIQVRERLGGTGVGDPNARIEQQLTGYRVAKAVLMDAAGRVTASVEPYYGASETFADLASAPLDDTGGTVQATFTTYDSRGRPTCAVRRFIAHASMLSSAAPASCVSSFGNDSAYALATVFRYRGVRDATANRNYLAVKTIPPENNLGTNPTAGPESFFGAAGRVLWTTDAEGNTERFLYDVLGRSTGLTREVAGAAKPAVTTSITLDLMGRATKRNDPNMGTRSFEYDPASPPLLKKVVFTKTGEEIRYSYDKGRIQEVCTAASSTSSCMTDSTWKYDVPYLPSGYDFTAGRLSWAYNQNTTIAFGYDDGGAMVKRDQWLAGMPTGTPGAFSWVESVTTEGFPLQAAFTTPFSTSSVATSYDSAGRPLKLTNGATVYWDATNVVGTGAYDAGGRLGAVKLDASRQAQSWSYGAFDSLLSAQSSTIGTTDVYRVTGFRYRGTKLESFTDSVTQTSYRYWYSSTGRLTAAKATPTSGAPAVACMGYSVSGKFGPGPSFGNLEILRQSSVTQDWVYSGTGIEGTAPAAGQDAPTSVNATPGTQSPVTYDAFGRVASYAGATFHHDLLGRMDWLVLGDGTREDLRYDPFGVLVSRQIGTTVVSYVGDRATITGTLAAGCSTPSCGINPATVQVDVHLAVGGVRVASVSSGAGGARTLYLHRDRLGSIEATTLGGGATGATYRWGVHGALESAAADSGSTRSELGYAGALRVSGGLLVMGVRVYHPGLRTFLEPDPLEPFKYNYAGGDPVNRVDPLGMTEDTVVPSDSVQMGYRGLTGGVQLDTVCYDGICGPGEVIDVIGRRGNKLAPGDVERAWRGFGSKERTERGSSWRARFQWARSSIYKTILPKNLGSFYVGATTTLLVEAGVPTLTGALSSIIIGLGLGEMTVASAVGVAALAGAGWIIAGVVGVAVTEAIVDLGALVYATAPLID